jgi:hypothetical protein
MRIGLVNCAELPEPDLDEQPLLEALRARGHDATSAAWDDPDIDWSSFDCCPIRATWNYAQHPQSFIEWMRRADKQTRLLNPLSTLEWNLHKGYLKELDRQGIPVIPTAFSAQRSPIDVRTHSADRGWTRIVIKPTISAGSFCTRAFDLNTHADDAQSFFDEMIESREMMIQRYIPSVDTVGETSIVVIAGEITHAVEKRPRFDDQEEQVFLRDLITHEMRSLARRVLEAARKEHLYARVDVMPNDDGSLMLSELEMLEPSLFFTLHPSAADTFVRALEDYPLS